MVGGSKIVIIGGKISLDEGLGPKIVIIWWEDPRLSLFGGRIYPDYGWRIQDFHYPVGESLRIVAGGIKAVIIMLENLPGLWRKF